MRVFYWSFKLIRKVSCTSSYARCASWINVDHGEYGLHHRLLVIHQNLQFSSSMPHLFSSTQTDLPWKKSLRQNPVNKLEAALEKDSVEEAWEVFSCYNYRHGFPKQILVKKMISLMTRSLSSDWLLKAYKLVLVVLNKSPHLLEYESLTRLAIILARSQMPVPASKIIRIALHKFKFPSFDILSTMFFHLVKSDVGSYLASNILIEICDTFLHQKENTRDSKRPKMLSPNVTIFNLILDSCSKFESFQKALLLIRFMSRMGVIADANSIVIFGRIYEKIGQRDELIRLKALVDSVSFMTFSRHYSQFYDSLLNLHFKYNDLDAAAKLILDLYSQSKPLQSAVCLSSSKNAKRKACSFQIGSGNLSMGYKVWVDPELLGSDFTFDSSVQSDLILFSDGNILPSTKAFAKLISGFVKEGRAGAVSNLLIDIEKKVGQKKDSFSLPFLVAFIQLGWLKTAHDVLDDLELAGICIEANLYISLFQAYHKQNLFEEYKVLLKQMRRKGLFESLSDEDAVQSCLSEIHCIKLLEQEGDFSRDKSCLIEHLCQEIREEDLTYELIYEFNSTILFFCNANMMDDALKTVRKMQQKNIQPTTQTFSYLLNGFSSLKMYREITLLWGEIKRRLEDGVLTVDLDLFECLLMNFIRGGYFERVMEIAEYMKRHNMFVDKWKYKAEFLKIHKNLYRHLIAADTKTDAQRMRLEHVQAFRKWTKNYRL